MENRKLNAACRVALAAYLHDLGKFAERARIEVDADTLDSHVTQYCPWRQQGGFHTHKHAAYTAIAWDLIEQQFPELLGDDVEPFAAWNDRNVDDSIVNAAAMHHKPATYLQWIVATADRVASGFERDEFDQYNQAEDKTRTGKNHYTARLLTLVEQIDLDGSHQNTREAYEYRYPMRAQCIESFFPLRARDCESNDNKRAQREYRELWEAFRKMLGHIPASHRDNWALWLDHFDSAWAAFTQMIPAATAFNVRPDVSLYDHSRTTAAMATALWRYHDHEGHDPEQVRAKLSDRDRPDWDQQKLLLIQGDFFGIQDFIFATGGETQRRAAKLLRGRSFYISLLCECAALKVLETLALPPTSQVINAAGKFLIVAPNTVAARDAVAKVQRELDQWFLTHTWGQSSIGLAFERASCNDFLKNSRLPKDARTPFQQLMKRLFESNERAKARRFELCSSDAPTPLLDGFLGAFSDKGVCAIDGRSPATERLPGEDERFVSRLAADQIRIGEYLARYTRLVVAQEPVGNDRLSTTVFGFHVGFTGGENRSGAFGDLANSGIVRRLWDFAGPVDAGEILFAGYAKRFINGYVPRFSEINERDSERYAAAGGDLPNVEAGAPKTFEHIACEDRWLDEDYIWRSESALTVLKGDIDNLGLIFQRGLGQPTFARQSALSRQINAFFTVYLPYLCANEYPNTYTVFAGGDDFFLIGPWMSTITLARTMRQRFAEYVAGNPQLHFSAGMVMAKTGIPVRQLATMAEDALDRAKGFGDGMSKNAVTALGYTASWEDYGALIDNAEELERIAREMQLSTGYVYGMQNLADMAEDVASGSGHVESALWNSHFNYRTWRMLLRQRGLDDAERRRRQTELGRVIGGGITQFGAAYRLPLSLFLYKHRR